MTGRRRRVLVEIRAAEGGDDAKSLVGEQLGVYRNLAARRGLRLDVVERTPSAVAFSVDGPGAEAAFADEAGGHRWQRVPPNERRGRVHTSTVTVAVLDPSATPTGDLDPRDVAVEASRGSGPGGQHRNTSDTCIVARHRPTGLAARCDETPSQHRNRELALALLAARVRTARERAGAEAVAAERRRQVGSGMRGDKRRTIRTQDGVVTDHVTGRRWELRRYLRGEW